ncbi:MAG: hypothetical protein Crog4KO_18540 [Crocinitomicaceae bacterium]
MKDLILLFTLALLLPGALLGQEETLGTYSLFNDEADLYLTVDDNSFPSTNADSKDGNSQLIFKRNDENLFTIHADGSSLGAYREGGDGDYKLKFLSNKADLWRFAKEDGKLAIRHDKTGWYLVLDNNNAPALAKEKNGSKGAWNVVQGSQPLDIRSVQLDADDETTLYRIEIYHSNKEGMADGSVNEGFMQVPQDQFSLDVFLSYEDGGDAMYWALVRSGDVTSIINKHNGKRLNMVDNGDGTFTAGTSYETTSPWFLGCAEKDNWDVSYCGLQTYVGSGGDPDAYEQAFLYPGEESGVTTWKPGSSFNQTKTRIWTQEKDITATFLTDLETTPPTNAKPAEERPVSVPSKAVYMSNTLEEGKLHNSRSRSRQAEYSTTGRGIGAQWKLEPKDEGTYRILNMQTGRYLGTLGSATSGSTIVQTKITGTGCEWYVEITSEGNYRFKNSQSELYLAIVGKKLVQVFDSEKGTEWILK